MKKLSILKAKHLKVGKKGEKIACRFLKNKYYDILARNYKTKRGEVDIIARDGGTLCFVEVKTRSYSKNKIFTNETWLTRKQAERIQRASKDYIFELNSPRLKYRYELVEIILSRFRIVKFYHWQTNFGMRN